MKAKIQYNLYSLVILLIITFGHIDALAQGTVSNHETIVQIDPRREPGIDILPTPQPPPGLAPESTIIPCVSIRLQGRGDNSSFIDGFSIEVRGQSDAIEGFVLLEDGRPVGPITRSFSSVIANRRFLGGYQKGQEPSPITFTVAALTKRSLADLAGNGFSVNIVGIITESPVYGSLPMEGTTKTLDSSLRLGRLTVHVAGLPIQEPLKPLFPLVSMQMLGEVLALASPEEDQNLPLLTLDIHTDGGRADDVSVGLYRYDGTLAAGPQQVEASILVGQGTVKFNYPFRVEKGSLYRYKVGVRLGDSWKDGGTVVVSTTPSKSVARGSLYGYATIPAPRTTMGGPVMSVTPVIIGASSAVQVPIQGLLPGSAGSLVNMAEIAVTAPADKDLVIPSLGVWLGWMPAGVQIKNLNFYGSLDSGGIFPIGNGLRGDGIFRSKGVNLGESYRQFSSIEIGVEDTNGYQSAIIVPAGLTRYFLLRGDYEPSGPNATVFAGIYNPYDGMTLALQYLFR